MNKTKQAILDDFKVSLEITQENLEYLKSKGYEQRSGTCAYERSYYTILPFKKWFWESTHAEDILLEVEQVVTTSHKLKVTKKR